MDINFLLPDADIIRTYYTQSNPTEGLFVIMETVKKNDKHCELYTF
jgi:hypothetical protein